MTRLRGESGSALVIALMTMGVMLAMGLGVFGFVQGQQRVSGTERVQESSYNLADTALEAAIVYLKDANLSVTNRWGSEGSTAQSACTSASPAAANCPDAATINAPFTQGGSARNPDYGGAPNWTVEVWDNAAPNAGLYQEGVTNGSGANMYDASGDGRVWVRAQGIARGRRRVVVALVAPRDTAGPTAPPLYSTAFAGGDISIEPAGTTRFTVDTQGDEPVAGRLDFFCHSNYPAQGQVLICPAADSTKGQIYPWTVSTGQPGNQCIDEQGDTWTYDPTGNGGVKCWSENAGADTMELRARAQEAGTYYNGTCPASLAGEIVFIDRDPVTPCLYDSGNTTWNTEDDPGMLVMGRGSGISIGGSNTYHGLIYVMNSTQGMEAPGGNVGISGGGAVIGGVLIEFASQGFQSGIIFIDSSRSPSLTFSAEAFSNLEEPEESTGGTASGADGYRIVPGTYRELPAT